MYARYIPPAKDEKKRKREGAEAGDEGAIKETKKSRTEEKASTQETLTQGTLVGEPLLPESQDTAQSKKDRKKRKKEKERESQVSEDVETTSVTKEQKKEKKREKKENRKKRKRKIEDVDGEQTETDDDKDIRYKAVLEKKEKALKMAQEQARQLGDSLQEEVNETDVDRTPMEEAETHGLEPLPQPEPVKTDTSQPGFEAMPSWVANPVRVTNETRVPFTELGISDKVAKVLQSKGYSDAFAVQAAAIPLLLPTAQRRQGDVLISAATGSGKTLACAIPVVRDISRGGRLTRLRAIVVLPTRELVKQAQEVFEACAAAFAAEDKDSKRALIGVAFGSQSLKDEQARLIERLDRYDPDALAEMARWRRDHGDDWDEEYDEGVGREYGSGVKRGTLPGHVVDFWYTVDVLICTPGRLVDHIDQTLGFSLQYVRWLVVDEGDKLLGQNYQGWIKTVMERLRQDEHGPPSRIKTWDSGVIGARNHRRSNFSGVRKIILSATLTQRECLTAMSELELRDPTLVMFGGNKEAAHVLPATLIEGALRFKGENLKPLYLHELLMSKHMRAGCGDDGDVSIAKSLRSLHLADASSKSEKPINIPFTSTALIFTKSNESALRLSRLLPLLNPSLEPLIGTLTSATPPHTRRKTIASFTARRIRLLVASDLVARGIDLPHLDHVVNYDLPASLEAYVHRVGRTARAGRKGFAWTLLPDGKESGWFWGEVAKGKKIARNQKVERIRVGDADGVVGEDRVEAYELALQALGREARGQKK